MRVKRVTDKMLIKALKKEFLAEGSNFNTNVMSSNPPKGKCKVTNIYADPKTNKLGFDYIKEK